MSDDSVNEQYLHDINAVIDLVRAGDIDDALGEIQSCIAKYPASPELLLLTSVCSYRQGDVGQAIELCESAHKIDPDGQEIVDSLAVLHVLVGNHNEGLYFAKLATTLTPHPDLPDLLPLEFSNFFAALSATRPSRHYLDGIFSFNARNFPDAIRDFERELRINPDNEPARKKLGHALVRQHCPRDALAVLETCAGNTPGDGEVSALMALAHCQLANFDDAVPLCRRALEESPGSTEIAMLVLESSTFFGAKHADAHEEFVTELNTRTRAAIENEDISEGPRPKGEKETINVAFVSNAFYDSDLFSFILPVFEKMDTSRFTYTAYQQSPTGGASFNELKDKSENWRRIVDMDDDVIDLIMDRTHTDIVVDLCGFSENGRPGLFAMSRNRIVTNLFCLPYGDGMANDNLVISDAVTAENDAAALRPDQINVAIESGLFAINEPRLMGDVGDLPASKNGFVTFGGTASLKHVSGETVEMWTAILNAVPDSRLHLGYVRNVSPEIQERAAAMFTDAGLGDRVSVRGTAGDQRANPRYFNDVDIFLDTYPVGNPLNAAHALWMGVPVISRKGASRRSMVGASILNAAGKPQWIANSDDDAVEIAQSLSSDIDALSEVRASLREEVRASKLLDTGSFVKELENAFEKAVQARAAKK